MRQTSRRFPLFLCHAQLDFREKGCFSAYLSSLARFKEEEDLKLQASSVF